MSSNDETDHDHERLARVRREWSGHTTLSEADESWLLSMASRALRAEAALPKGVPAIFFEVPRSDLEVSARSLSRAVSYADIHAARHGFDQPHPNDLPVGMPIDPASPTGDHTSLLTLGDLRQADQTASAAAAEIRALREALEFYADPDTYAGIGFLPDRPCGDFIDDFDDTHDPGYPKPGKRARAVLDMAAAVGAEVGEYIIDLEHLSYIRADLTWRDEATRLRAKLVKSEGEIATMRRAFFEVAMIQARELQRLDPTGNTPPDLDAAMADLRAALTNSEPTHGD